MGRKRHKSEEIIAKLRQVDVLTAQGTPVAETVRSIGVTEVTYYRWRGFGRETVVLPTRARRHEAVQRRSIGAPKESLTTALNKVRVQGPENARQFAPRQGRKHLLYQQLSCWRWRQSLIHPH